eukprot:2125083-Pyramimonas_sp.AAC.1
MEKGARVLDLMKTPSGHLALKVDEYGAATEDKGSMSFTISASPQCEDDPLLVKEAYDPQPAAGAPAMIDARTYDVTGYQGHQLVHQRGDVHVHDPVFGELHLEDLASQEYAKIYQAIHEEGAKSTPPDAQAGTPAEGDDAAEKFEFVTSSSGSAAQHGAGIWTPPSPNE